jgi:hypothetical protein
LTAIGIVSSLDDSTDNDNDNDTVDVCIDVMFEEDEGANEYKLLLAEKYVTLIFVPEAIADDEDNAIADEGIDIVLPPFDPRDNDDEDDEFDEDGEITEEITVAPLFVITTGFSPGSCDDVANFDI